MAPLSVTDSGANYHGNGAGQVTVPDTLAEGDRLIATVAHRSSNIDHAQIDPGPWIERVDGNTLPDDDQARRGVAIFEMVVPPGWDQGQTFTGAWYDESDVAADSLLIVAHFDASTGTFSSGHYSHSGGGTTTEQLVTTPDPVPAGHHFIISATCHRGETSVAWDEADGSRTAFGAHSGGNPANGLTASIGWREVSGASAGYGEDAASMGTARMTSAALAAWVDTSEAVDSGPDLGASLYVLDSQRDEQPATLEGVVASDGGVVPVASVETPTPPAGSADVDVRDLNTMDVNACRWSGQGSATVYAVGVVDLDVNPSAATRRLLYVNGETEAINQVAVTSGDNWFFNGDARAGVSGAATTGQRVVGSIAYPYTVAEVNGIYAGRVAASDSIFPGTVPRVLIYHGVVHDEATRAATEAWLAERYDAVAWEA